MLTQRKFSQFLASAAPAALGCVAVLAVASPALADTTVSTGTTATYQTSAAGNVTIASTGTLTGASGPVVTVDSSSNVTVSGGGIINAGTATTAANGAIGIQLNPGVTTTITNTGSITALENFTPTTISSGFVESAVSGVSGRYGIYGAAGTTINGTIVNSAATTVGSSTYTGTITIDGEHSAGIQIDGDLKGSLNTQGAIAILGDSSYGVKLNTVTGNVTIGGTVQVTGSASQGYVQSGAVTGAILIDGAITNGYSYTDTSGTALVMSRSLLNTGTPVGTTYLAAGLAPIVEIDGNVTGGVLINAPTTSTSTDTNRGSITSYGNNPALQIGGATNITIGSGTTNNGAYALGIDGSVAANSYTTSTAAYATVIGGRGGNVTLTNGLEVYGTVSATTIDTAATALLINSGSVVGTILNTGTIKATASQQTSGNVYAIQDLSGSVTSLTNQGYISGTAATALNATSAAIDLRANTTGVTLTQSYTSANQTNETTDKAATTYNPATATLYAGITGDIYLGTGNNTINIQSGSITGNTYIAGGNTTISLADVTRWVGNINFAGAGTETLTMTDNSQLTGNLALAGNAGTLTLSSAAQFLGTVTGGSAFNVVVNGGIFGANAVGTTTINSLNVASGGNLRVYIDGTTATSSLLQANSATFASGAKISLYVNSLSNITKKYDVLTATTLTGASTLTNSSLDLPVLFNGTISTDANNVYVDIERATAAQLGLTTAQSAAYTAILNDAANNTLIQSTLLQIYDTPTLRGRFNELLPNYAGGTFDVVTRASRLAAKHLDDDSTMFSISDSAAWIEPIVFTGTRTFGDTPGFKSSGGGLSMGYEKVTPLGNIGLTLAWLTGDAKSATYQSVKTNAFQIGTFWRKSSGNFYIWGRGSLGRESFKSSRTFFGQYTTTTQNAVTTSNFTYAANGHWAGWSAALTGGASYTVPMGDHFSLRPRGFLEYDRLQENRYIETGDTPIALTVGKRTSSQTVATTTLAALWSAGPSNHEGRPFTVELEAGRRTWLAGNLGTTTATFETGDTFSINGGHLPSAWVGQFSIMQGGLDYTWKVGTDIERGADKGVAYGVKASISIAL